MELELGLSLVSSSKNDNGFGFESRKQKQKMGVNPWSHNAFRGSVEEEEEDDDPSSPTLNLLLWSGNRDGDDGNREKNGMSSINRDDDEDESGELVGWPPIKSWRRKMFHQRQEDDINHNLNYPIMEANPMIGEINDHCSKYVKVKMEGMAITRKIDLTLFHSYQTLTNSLLTMFAKCQNIEKNGEFCYTLAYQDKDGDWLLAGDVPWETFIQSVMRLKIVKNGS